MKRLVASAQRLASAARRRAVRIGLKWYFPVVVICVAVLFCWNLHRSECRELQRLAQTKARALERQLSQRLQARVDSILYFARKWALATPQQNEWESDAALFVRYAPDLQALEWVDPSLHVRWIAPRAGNEAILDQPSAPEARRREALEKARLTRQPIVTPPVDLIQGGRGVLVYVPLFREGTFDGFLVGVFRASALFQGPQHKQQGATIVQISAEGSPLYEDYRYPSVQAQPLARLTGTCRFHLYGVNWRVSVVPTPETNVNGGAMTRWSLLISGLVISALLNSLSRSYQTIQQRQKELAAANRALQATAAEHVKTIDELKQALAEVKSLQGIIPICAGCKRIRDDNGYWSQVEAYISAHCEARFSHGLCPECVRHLYPDEADSLPPAVAAPMRCAEPAETMTQVSAPTDAGWRNGPGPSAS